MFQKLYIKKIKWIALAGLILGMLMSTNVAIACPSGV